MELKQKFAMCWTLLHFCLLKMPGLSKSPGGGKIAFDFMVRMLTGTYGTGLFTSLIASTIHGHELNKPHTPPLKFARIQYPNLS